MYPMCVLLCTYFHRPMYCTLIGSIHSAYIHATTILVNSVLVHAWYGYRVLHTKHKYCTVLHKQSTCTLYGYLPNLPSYLTYIGTHPCQRLLLLYGVRSNGVHIYSTTKHRFQALSLASICRYVDTCIRYIRSTYSVDRRGKETLCRAKQSIYGVASYMCI